MVEILNSFFHIMKLKPVILLPLLLACSMAFGQTISTSPGEYYERHTLKEQDPTALSYIREDDVVWEYMIWRTIDLREKFNHFFYFPLERKGAEGHRNFAYTLWDAIVTNEVPIFADDEMKIPIDNDQFVFQYTKADTLVLEIVDDEENYEYRTVLVPKEFNSEEVLQIKLKEIWYINKQTTEQAVRIVGCCLTKELYKEHDGDMDYIGTAELFWIPMLSYQARKLLSTHQPFFVDNLAGQPSWEQVFNTRMFSSYVTRESNRFNRAITDYVTGTDAVWESERIEAMLLEISSDMWEY